MNGTPYIGRHKPKGRYRGRGDGAKVGGYRSEPAGDGQGGVWTLEMRAAEAARRRALV